MLNEFSDKVPEGQPRPFVMSGEFWLGVFSVLIIIALILGFMI
jgi:hypothetical protein